MPGPAATVGSMHICPMCSGTVPHVGGPVSLGVSNVLINGKPAATVGSMCICVGPPDTIVQGESGILINNMPAAAVGAGTAHGGAVTSGEAGVLYNTGVGAATATVPIDRLNTPEINVKNKVLAGLTGNSKLLKEAQQKQQINEDEAKEHGFLGHFSFSI